MILNIRHVNSPDSPRETSALETLIYLPRDF